MGNIFEVMPRSEIEEMFSSLATPENISNINAQLADIANGTGTYGAKSDRPTTNLYPGRQFFLTDMLKHAEFNGSKWQYFDGSPVDVLNIKDGNLYPNQINTATTYTPGTSIPGNTSIDMTKDFIGYAKFKLADNNDYVHFSFKIGTTYQFQLSFGYDWTTSTKDGVSISIYDYINTTKTKLGTQDVYSASHEVIVWYDHKWQYLNVYVDNVLIGSWQPTTGGANINGVNTASMELGSTTTSMTLDYLYMATPLVTAIGDSITAGQPAYAPDPNYHPGVDDYSYNWPKLISDYLQSKGIKNYFVCNRGVNSDTTIGMKNRFTADVINTHCKYVMIHGGINDYTTNDPNATVSNKKSMADSALANGIEPLILGVLVTETNSVSNSHQFSIDLHTAEQAGYLNYNYGELWHVLEGSTPDVADSSLMTDTVHPNSTGYHDMAAEIEKYVIV